MIFSTKEDLRHLNSANYWVMDGTFKIVPILFLQIYTIHASVGSDSNNWIFPLVYCLLTLKLQLYMQNYLAF